jgi:hypothetical protein
MNIFDNGPLPEELEQDALRIEVIDAFALKCEPAKLYCRWAERNGVIVEGFEVWIVTEQGPSVVSGAVFDGSPSECASAIDDYSARLSDWEVYFVLFTKKGTTGPTGPLT